MQFDQLISTRFTDRRGLPDGLVTNPPAGVVELPRVYRANQTVSRADLCVRAAANDTAGHTWIATDSGAFVTNGSDWGQSLDRTDGMPFEDLECLAIAPNGDLWGGTTQGAWRLRSGRWRYFWGKRWLPGNRVSEIAFDVDGSVWLATDQGIARIEERPITLAGKADHYEEITAARHNRRGWIAGCDLMVAGDAAAGFRPEASDNDGLWTAIYVAAEAFRYAVTGDDRARDLAAKSMNAMLDLVRLSGYPGFPARAIVDRDEDVAGYDPEETVRVPGETDRIWYSSPVCSGALCKGDTSSDELDGHYFAWYVYHELAADRDEKSEIRRVVAAVTDNLLHNGFVLVGHTGRRTRWGVFDPESLNNDPRWAIERGLNSLEILSHLKVAEHICSDVRYGEAYDELVSRHHYLLNTLEYRRGWPWHAVNHSDDELAFLAYYPLLALEHEPARRTVLLESLAGAWREIARERSPFYNFVFGALTGERCGLEDALQTLVDWPWELIRWDMRNSHRHDVCFRRALGVREAELERVLPASERALQRWNANPFAADGGDGGKSEDDAAAWLLPYWMGRYHGLITG